MVGGGKVVVTMPSSIFAFSSFPWYSSIEATTSTIDELTSFSFDERSAVEESVPPHAFRRVRSPKAIERDDWMFLNSEPRLRDRIVHRH